MVGKKETITAHVMALSHEKLKKSFDINNPGDVKRLDRWHKRLQPLPDDPTYIDKLFEPFYAEKQMPEPADLMAEHWRVADPSKLICEADSDKPRELIWENVRRGAKTPYAKAVCALVYERRGRPTEKVDGRGRATQALIRPANKMTQEEYTQKLVELGIKYNVKWEGYPQTTVG